MLCAAGWLQALHSFNPERGRSLTAESVALYRQLEEPAGLARALAHAAFMARDLDYAVRLTRLEEALALARTTGDQRLIAWVLNVKAWWADLSQPAERAWARSAAEESLALFQVAGWVRMYSIRRVLGRIMLADGDLARARDLFLDDLELTRAMGDGGGVTIALGDLAVVALAQGAMGEAARCYAESLRTAIARDRRPPSWLFAVEGLAEVAAMTGRAAEAARLLGAAEAIGRQVGYQRDAREERNYERAVAAARAALNERAFAAAWAAGAGLTVEAAVDEALREAQTPPDRPDPPAG